MKPATKAQIGKQRELFSNAWREIKPPSPKEVQIHISLFEHLRLRRRENVLAFHVPNGGYRDKREGAKLRAMGVKPGVSDVTVIHRRDGALRVLFLELKADRGKPTDAQIEFAKEASAIGCDCEVAVGIDEALAVLERHEILKPNKQFV